MATTDTRKARALACIESKQFEKARRIFAELCTPSQQDAEVWFLLGAVNGSLGNIDEVIACSRTALDLRPDYTDAYFNLAMGYRHKGVLHEAEKYFREILRLDPQHAATYYHLGLLFHEQSRLDEAAHCLTQLLRVSPGNAEVHYLLGTIHNAQGQYSEAVAYYRIAVRLKPEFAEVYNNLGNALAAQGLLDEAVANYQEGLRLMPQAAEMHNNLGNALCAKGQLAMAISSFQRALHYKPDYARAMNNLGNALFAQGVLGEAAIHFQHAIRLQPNYAEAYNNLGNVLYAQGQHEAAIQTYRQAVDIQPEDADTYSNLLFCMCYTNNTPHEIFTAHQRWDARYGVPAQRHPQHPVAADSTRRLRVGYVSPDFRNHSVARFFEPLLANHDPQVVETFCYADVAHPDAATARLRALSNHWRSICGLSYDEVAGQIRRDEIDILVDLAGHTSKNWLPVFARKPAPVQVTYLGYPNTTGLTAMDYRFTDACADPPGNSDEWYTETLVRLPQGFLCFQPPLSVPAIDPAVARDGAVTFGSFNALPKMGDDVLALWASILRAIPDSRLILKNQSLHDAATRERLLAVFAEHAIDRQRIDLIGWVAEDVDHLTLYNKIDIALDTFPYNGTTTTCEALWMGVPVITLAGNTHAGRVSASLLTRLAMDEFIARSKGDYVNLARCWANDPEQLTQLRSSLRARMAASPLCDGAAFARHVEQAYRDMWTTRCESGDH